MTTTEPMTPPADVTRRTMLRGATVGGVALPLLAACGGGEDGTGSASSETTAADPSSSAATSPSPAEGGGVTVPAADVPVGGGTILKADKVVVTQPTEGEFKAFDATCTHKGCLVNKIDGDKIVCPCHGSMFSITDGSVVDGPAPSPLGAKTATVEGDQVTVA